MNKLIYCFTLISLFVNANLAIGQCVSNTSNTYNPPPTGGQYESGQTVEICGQFSYSQSGAIWVHGIVPIIPEGWDMSSLQVDPPNSCSGSGVWGWYESVTGTAGSAGTYGPGIFYDQGGDGNPGNNFGDNCFGGVFTFCITLTVTDDCQNGALDGTDLSIDFMILGDNSSGSWNNSSCGQDIIPGANATLNCCSGEEIEIELCSTDPNELLFNSFSDTPAGGSWESPSGGAFNGTFIPGTSPDGLYTYSFDTGDCAAESTAEVTTITAPDAGNGQNITVCESEDPFDLNDQIVGGDPGGSWTDPYNDNVSATFTPGTSEQGLYTYSVGDGVACPVSETVVIVSVEPNPHAGDDGALTVCESDAELSLFNFLLDDPDAGGTWTDPSGNAHDGNFSPGNDDPGSYTYSIGDPPCDASAVVVVTVIELPYAGENTELEVCANGDPIDLFTLLPGADGGGFWADPNNAGFGGTFSPGVDDVGIYTYQIGGAACNDQATVEVSTAAPPTGLISAQPTYCQGTDLTINFELSGEGPFDVTFEVSGVATTIENISDGHSTSISPSGDITIELINITDYSSLSCQNSGNSIDVEMIPTPTATITGGGGLCAGSDGSISFELNGEGPFDIVYSDGTNEFTLNGIDDGHSEDVTPNENTTYTLVSVSDNSASSCDGVVDGSAVFNVNEPPSGTISGDANVCVGESTDLTFNFTGDGPFDVVYNNGAEDFALNGIEDGHTVSVSPQFLSFYQLVSVTSAGNPDCPGETNGFVEITVSVPPTYNNLSHVCNDISEAYTVTFTINGGDPNSYSVDGDSGNLDGNIFTSDEIASGEDYLFLLDDGNGCGPVEISGNHECDCITNAGSMQDDNLELCSTETAVAIHNGDEILDPNDILIFLLHDSPFYTTSNILAENDVPEFGFQPGMDFNTTYYITGIAGNEIDGTVGIDDCFSSTQSIPVVFIESPTVELSGSGAICPGEEAALEFEFTGTAPWQVEYAVDGVSTGSFNSNNASYTLNVDEPGTYTVLSVSDDICTGSTEGEVEVLGYDEPTANISGGGNICSGSGDGPEITLTGDGPWTVGYAIDGVEQPQITVDNSPFTIAAEESGTYTLLDLTDSNCSGSGTGSADVEILDLPVASVSGGGQVCAGDEGEIIFQGTGNGTVSVSYAIDGVLEGSIDLDGGTATLNTNEGGIYTITGVTDDFCTGDGDGSSATLTVNPIPTADITLEPSAICEGDSALLSISLTGNGPFDLVYTSGDDLIILENTQNINQYITPDDGEEFTLISIEDSSDPRCSQNLSDAVVASVLTAPEPPALNDIFRCNNDTFPHIGVESIDGLSYSWSPQNGVSNPNISNPLLQLENPGGEPETYQYTLTVSNGICASLSTMDITIDPGPDVGFSYNPKPVSTEATTVNFFNTTSGINTYFWEFAGLGTATSTNAIFAFPPEIEGKYPVSLTATDPETGCSNVHTTIVEVVGELTVFVPNAFTPNGDGNNDLFAPVVRNHRPGSYEFVIFNRQGELVFQASSPDQKWDGGDRSEEYLVQDAVYVWRLKVGDIYSTESKEYRGSVTVLR